VAVLGRSRECDCVLNDPNVSRRHAELRRNPTGDWQIVDLGSTNGVKVNDRQVDTSRLAPGDQVSLGTIRFTFDIES
jgi:pSer/pThr/pTyr-binding forkhead associated (FHA) protein